MPEPAVPRDAATVLLLRDAAAGLEVYLLRRVKGMPFAGGMTAYPGGTVDARDTDVDIAWTGPPPAAWAESFGCTESLARALVCAAVRETFEESGVLLAATADEDSVGRADEDSVGGADEDSVGGADDDSVGGADEDSVGGADEAEVVVADDADWEAERQALLRREHSLAELLTRRRLRLRADLLRPWAHWITPEDEPRRYDTRFFVAALPAGVHPRDISGEADEAVWVTVAQALAQNESGDRPMLAPTLYTLRDIAAYTSVADVLAAAPPGRLDTVQPRLEYDVDGEFVVMPDGSRMRPPIRLGRGR